MNVLMRFGECGWWRVRVGVVFLLVVIAGGCAEKYRAKKWIDSDSSVMIQDMTEAAGKGDTTHEGEMVDALSADDPAVRFYAIASLKKLTGEDLGYVYYADEPGRRGAVLKWQAWLKRSGS